MAPPRPVATGQPYMVAGQGSRRLEGAGFHFGISWAAGSAILSEFSPSRANPRCSRWSASVDRLQPGALARICRPKGLFGCGLSFSGAVWYPSPMPYDVSL